MPEMKSLTLNDKTYDCFVDSVARSQLETYALIDSASGERITLPYASNYKMTELHIYGKTTQDGIPTPTSPIELVSVGGGGSITVNVTGENRSQRMTIPTPNDLPGIPVDSGGNYTDVDGQQWICDEIDLARGVYVQRISKIVMDETTFINVGEHTNGQRYCTTAVPGIIKLDAPGSKMLLSDRYEATGWTNLNNKMYSIGGAVVITDNRFIDLDTTTSIFRSERPKIVYSLATPIEIPLSEEELATFAALRTYRDHTTVSNDAGAYMELEYVMDAKKYIDSLVIPGGASARLSDVTILASAWKTEADGLHSQVVNIAGVTEYSKVDLLPSVEQLAIFRNKDVAFVTENEDGVVTVYAIGDKPTQDYTMQVSITEVVV